MKYYELLSYIKEAEEIVGTPQRKDIPSGETPNAGSPSGEVEKVPDDLKDLIDMPKKDAKYINAIVEYIAGKFFEWKDVNNDTTAADQDSFKLYVNKIFIPKMGIEPKKQILKSFIITNIDDIAKEFELKLQKSATLDDFFTKKKIE